MPDAKCFESVAEGEGFVAGAVVGHDAIDPDAEAGIVGNRCLENGDCTYRLFVRLDLGEGNARGIVDGDMDIFPAERGTVGARIALAGAVSGDAVTNTAEPAELLDIEMGQLARPVALIAAHRPGGFQVAEPGQAGPAQHPADSGR